MDESNESLGLFIALYWIVALPGLFTCICGLFMSVKLLRYVSKVIHGKIPDAISKGLESNRFCSVVGGILYICFKILTIPFLIIVAEVNNAYSIFGMIVTIVFTIFSFLLLAKLL